MRRACDDECGQDASQYSLHIDHGSSKAIKTNNGIIFRSKITTESVHFSPEKTKNRAQNSHILRNYSFKNSNSKPSRKQNADNHSSNMALWKSQEEDEFFGSPDEEPSYTRRRCEDGHELDSGLLVAESSATAQRFRNIGFHETYDQSKELKLQEGFEAGYRDSFELSTKIGELLGKAAMEAKLSEKLQNTNVAARQVSERVHMRAAQIIHERVRTIVSEENDNGIEDLKQLERDLKGLVSENRGV